tara:strand:- start:186 stop:797 length:612 start_codon:yes stop_codon:yes gene_type:complete
VTESHFLLINTLGGLCSVAVSRGNMVLDSQSIKTDKGCSEILLPMIENTLNNCKLSIKKLSGFLVCTGPGNYTSLRVAISTVRGLSLATGKPACGISLFELMSTKENKVLVVLEGPAKKIYVQNFSDGFEINPPRLLTLDEIKKTEEFFGAQTIGFQAKSISKLIKGKKYLECSKVSFKKFIEIGQIKHKKTCLKPTPLYIRT